jgi:hypothetical protein
MSQESERPLCFETMLTDPLTRLLMAADGVSLGEMIRVMENARAATVASGYVAFGVSPEASGVVSVP